jgi:hypothetical protein
VNPIFKYAIHTNPNDEELKMSNQEFAADFDPMSADLDQLCDAPSFDAFSNGVHKCRVNWEVKPQEGDKPGCTILKLECLEALQEGENEPGTAITKPGDKTSIYFYFKSKEGKWNEFTIGDFKVVTTGLKEAGIAGNTGAEIMANSEGAEVVVVTKRREQRDKVSKKPNGTYNTRVEAIASLASYQAAMGG